MTEQQIPPLFPQALGLVCGVAVGRFVVLGLRAWEQLAGPHTLHLPAPHTQTAG